MSTTITTTTRPAELEELERPAPIPISAGAELLESDLETVPVIVDSAGAESVRVPFANLRPIYGAETLETGAGRRHHRPIGETLRVSVLAVSGDPFGTYPAPIAERILEIVAGAELRIISPWQSTAGAVSELLEFSDLVFRISE